MSCPMVGGCAVFNDKMGAMPSMANIFKKKFCNNDDNFENCARYIVKQATGVAHPSLMPNQNENLDAVIADVKAGKV